MSKARSISARALALTAQVRAVKRSVRLIAFFSLITLASVVASSAASSAKLIDRLNGVTPVETTRNAAAPVAAAVSPVEQKPTISADKGVYEPGDTLTLNGNNWTPGESVKIVLSAGSSEGEDAVLEATADDNGSFVVQATMPEAERRENSEGSNRREVLFTAIATGATSGASARTHFKEEERTETEGEDDADLPPFMIGKVSKEDYFSRRDEHINRLRGVERGKPSDPGARGRAIRQLEQQEGRPDKKAEGGSNVASVSVAVNTGSGFTAEASATATGSPAWVSIGPAPLPNGQTFGVTQAVSGRVSTIAIHPSNPDIAYVGTAQGGVYRTLDGGATWTAIFDNAHTLAVGSIAIAPSQPSTIYVGTGEGNFGCDTYFGVGLYRIDNADGSSPTLTGPFSKDVANNDVLTGRAISKVLVHPSNPDIIFIAANSGGVGGIGCDAGTATASRGLYRSTNATSSNATFQKLTTNTANGGNRNVTDIEFEPGNPNTMLATVVGFNTASDGGVYRTTNALAASPSFSQTLSTGTATVTARVEIAITKVGGAVTVYAASSDASGTVKRSIDGGVTWSAALANATGFCGGQCTYDMPIAVDPLNASVLYIGGNADGATTAILKKSVNATSATPTFTKTQTGLHADSHSIEIDPSNNNTVWFGSDGGVWKSTNAAASWTSLNNTGFNATQFQSIALHPTDPNYTIGGTQDNGTERMRPDGTWTRTDYGDGGVALIDQNATNTTTVRQYHTYFNQVGAGGLVAFATSTSSTAFENWTALGCGGTANGLSCNDSAVAFYAPMALGPGSPNTVYFGTDRLYRSSNSGTTMTVVSQQFVNGVALTAIGISRQNDSVRIVGLRNGKVYRTMTGGATSATMTDVTGTIPARYIARTVIDPNNQNTAYVTVATFFGASTSHIYKTTNLSAATPTWTGIDGGMIPDVPVNAFVIDPADSNTLYAGTDIGVYRSVDGGQTWGPFSTGLPRVAVFDMAIQSVSRTLRIATHGRGMWELSIAASPAVIQGTVTDTGTNAPVANASVSAGSNSTSTDENGFYQFSSIPAGTYNMTVSAIGYNNGAATNVSATNGSITTKNFALNAAASSACPADTTQSDFQTGMASNVDATTTPGDLKLSLPAAVTEEQASLAFFVDSITATSWQAQTFIPTATGRLNQVDFQAALASGAVAGTLAVEIRNTVSGAPGSTVLATTNLTSVSGTGNAWYSVTFAAPASVNAGTSYAIVLKAVTGGAYRAVRSNGNVYANGAWYQSTTSGASWAAQTSDLAFRTYITPLAYAPAGNLVSAPKDANQADGTMAGWSTLSWNAATPAGTTVKFQVAGSNNFGGLYTFVGPDGTSASFFTASGASLSQFNGSRYLKYKAYLTTTNTTVTPTLSDVTICNSNTPLPSTSLNVSPASGAYGGTATLTATLTSGGSPLAGKPVVFKLNGGNFTGNSVLTDASGTATIQNVSLSGLNAGTYANAVTAKFASDAAYAGTNGSNSLTVEKVTPAINWVTPAAITYGTALDATQLNATASVPGSFIYTPAAGTILNAGDNQMLRAEFNPTDTVNYNKSLADVSINVRKAQATISLSDLIQNYNGSQRVAAATISPAGLGGVNITYDGANAAPTGAGSYAVVASLTNNNYQADNATGTLVVNKVAPVVTANGNTCTYSGSPCAGSGSAKGVEGADLGVVTLTYAPANSAPVNAGDYTVVASIGETANHTAGSSEPATIKVNKATPFINWNVPAAITYGTPLGGAQFNALATLTAGGQNVAGSFVYAPTAGTILNVGDNQTLHTEFTPADTANYNSASKDVSIDVRRATLTVRTVDSSKIYGSPNPAFSATYSGFLNGDTLTSLSGTLSFTTPATDSSNVGVYTVTPGGLSSPNYALNFESGSLTINKAALTVTTDNMVKIFGAVNPAFTTSYSGFVLGQGADVLGGALTFNTQATPASGVGSYAVTPGGLTSPNYSITFVDGTLFVTYGVCVQYDPSKAAQSGSTIPIKLQLCNVNAGDVSAQSVVVHAVSVAQVTNSAPATLADSGNANPDFNFRYTGAGAQGGYIFNLSTRGYQTGTYLLTFTVTGDSVPHTVQFSVR